MTILPHVVNRFNGIEISSDELPADAALFAQSLSTSLEKWIQDERFLVWLHLPIEKAALIPISTAAGFIFHHTQPNYVQLVCPLQADALIPEYATHYIGAGGRCHQRPSGTAGRLRAASRLLAGLLQTARRRAPPG